MRGALLVEGAGLAGARALDGDGGERNDGVAQRKREAHRRGGRRGQHDGLRFRREAQVVEREQIVAGCGGESELAVRVGRGAVRRSAGGRG